ncbi:ABC transporter ATP-binding protein [Vogesella sp. LIG4]|uniref:ABC transporter ATP-binding protein n=1 Tax=Vogesella sp. LIG4 TaxID=1192162 RepID=UPI00081FFBB0|nr:ABC transporter ATP-binding protein [Vogesella sp. LIG4]SCK29248.1 ABC-type Fe3+/spermidine/putrescine transport systems, ATPase components [Vogesella sp. LIG4]
MLRIEQLSLAFHRRRVLDGVSLQVAAGETLALLGPSGAGKSSLLAVLAGLQRPDAGSVSLHGRDLLALPPERRQLAMMFQDHALFPHLDAAANVAFGLVERGQPPRAARQQAEDMLAAVGLAGRGRAACHTLSGGERQRVALARALVCRPQLLLLDEPFSSLDTDLKQQLLADVAQHLAGLQVPALLVTHDRHEAFTLAQRVAILQHGRIVQQGTPAEILAQPASAWVARFVGFHNVFDGYAIPPQAFVLGDGQPQRRILAVAPQADGWRLTVAGDDAPWQLLLSPRELAGMPQPQVGRSLALGVRAEALLRWQG